MTRNYVSGYIVLLFIASYLQTISKKYLEPDSLEIDNNGCFVSTAASAITCVWLGAVMGRNTVYCFATNSNTFLAVRIEEQRKTS